MRVSDRFAPAAILEMHASEPRIATLDGREAVRLVDRDDAQPGEDRVALGLGAQEDHPRRLAGVLDELGRSAHDARYGAVEVALMPAVELVLVTVWRLPL